MSESRCETSEQTFPNLFALPGQTTPGRVTVTICRSALCPWPENENLTLLLNASYSPEVTSTVCRQGRAFVLSRYAAGNRWHSTVIRIIQLLRGGVE
jgi:hypothetical protein